MTKKFKKLTSFLMAITVTLSFSLSVVADEVTEVADVEFEENHTYDHSHDHGFIETIDIFTTIMAANGCPHYMTVIPGSEQVSGTDAILHIAPNKENCSMSIATISKIYGCVYGCGYTHAVIENYFQHSNFSCVD